MSILEIQTIIIAWGNENLRDFFWRSSEDPYLLLLSECFLQRTRAVQVNNFLKPFIEKYPNFNSIASASYDDLYSEMKTLGLHWRIKNVKKCAEIIIKKHKGIIPRNRKDLLGLPGVGEYVSGAYLICKENMKTYALDTNTVRLLGRLYGLKINDSARRSNIYKQKMVELLPDNNIREFFYKLLDFSHYICTSKNPDCSKCPINSHCAYFDNILIMI